MDEGDRAPLADSDFPEDALPEKSANMVQVETRTESVEPYPFCMTSGCPYKMLQEVRGDFLLTFGSSLLSQQTYLRTRPCLGNRSEK